MYEAVPHQSFIEDVEYLLQNLCRFAVHITDWNLCSDAEPRLPSLTCPFRSSGGCRRLAFLIHREELESLLELGFSLDQCYIVGSRSLCG